MAIKIPTFQNRSSKFTQVIVLDDVSITLSLSWNTRANYWFLTITDGINVLSSKKIVPNWPILKRNRASFPTLSGDFILLKTDEDVGSEITYDNLNDGYTFYYLTQLEVIEWESANGIG